MTERYCRVEAAPEHQDRFALVVGGRVGGEAVHPALRALEPAFLKLVMDRWPRKATRFGLAGGEVAVLPDCQFL